MDVAWKFHFTSFWFFESCSKSHKDKCASFSLLRKCFRGYSLYSTPRYFACPYYYYSPLTDLTFYDHPAEKLKYLFSPLQRRETSLFMPFGALTTFHLINKRNISYAWCPYTIQAKVFVSRKCQGKCGFRTCFVKIIRGQNMTNSWVVSFLRTAFLASPKSIYSTWVRMV